MLFLAVGVVLVAGYFFFVPKDKELARSQDYPQGFGHANQTAPLVNTEAQ